MCSYILEHKDSGSTAVVQQMGERCFLCSEEFAGEANKMKEFGGKEGKQGA